MFKVTKADTGASRICRDIAGYALGAAIVMAGVYVVLESIVAYEERPVRPVATLEVHADSGYARHVAKASKACQRAVENVALSMGPDIEKVDPRIWQAAYWQCLHNHGAML